MAQFVIEEVDRLSRTVGRYLQFARGGEQDVGRGDAIAALDQTLALLEGELAARKITVERFRGAGDSATVRLDPESLKQVYLNLLLNAADAMSGVDDRPRQLVVRTQPDGGDGVSLSVQDSGDGFAPEDGERLFEAFYTTKSQGMGIGLSVSRSIIERHEGRLWAARNEGPGATFAFTIPLGRPATEG